MSTHPTALDLDSFDAAFDSVATTSHSNTTRVRRTRRRLNNVTGILGALMVTPFVVLALATLVFLFFSKLLIELVAAGFER